MLAHPPTRSADASFMQECATLTYLALKVDLRNFKIWLGKMNNFNDRLESFKNWRLSLVAPQELAASGFYLPRWKTLTTASVSPAD